MTSLLKKSTQSGNVLFLILIAVALFAALSYAITQSTRGGGNAGDETSRIDAAQIVQFPTFLKQSIMRMQLTGGSAATDIKFVYDDVAAPGNQGDWNNQFGYYDDDPENELFNPAGGGLSFQQPNAEWCISNTCGYAPFVGHWRYFVSGGTTSGKKMLDVGTANADTIMVLGPVSLTTCNAINEHFGLGTPPAQDMNGTETYEAYPGEEFFCMEINNDVYWYLHTLIAY